MRTLPTLNMDIEILCNSGHHKNAERTIHKRQGLKRNTWRDSFWWSRWKNANDHYRIKDAKGRWSTRLLFKKVPEFAVLHCCEFGQMKHLRTYIEIFRWLKKNSPTVMRRDWCKACVPLTASKPNITKNTISCTISYD